MSQSDARRRRRECKRAGRHLEMKTHENYRLCAHCGWIEQIKPAGPRGVLAEIVPGSRQNHGK